MSDKELVGVKGWLKLFVIWLCATSVVGLVVTYGNFELAEMERFHVTTIEGYQSYKTIVILTMIFSAIVKINAAYNLYSQHEKSNAVFAK